MIDNITVTDISEIFLVTSPKGRAEKIQNRKSWGLSFCIDGQIVYTHNGREVISDKDNAVILPQGKTYTVTGTKSGVFPVINFKCEKDICDTIVSISIHDRDIYLKAFEKLRALSIRNGNRAEMMSIFYGILSNLSLGNTQCEDILPAVKYIEENYQSPYVTNASLAAMCNISEVYFRRIFKRHYNMSPKQFIIEMRINKAKQLLTEGVWKINAVAARCGFTNQYHFCRIFREKTGLTPTEYMKQNRILGI